MTFSKLYRFQNRLQRYVLGKLHWPKTFRRAEFDPARPPSRVLIVVAGLIGDSVMSTPGIIAARRVWPDAHITLLGRRHNAELFAACPLLDEIKAFDTEPLTIRYRYRMRELKGWMRRQDFDVAILLLASQYAHLVAAAGIPVRVGERGDWQENSLTHKFEVHSPREWGPPERLNAIRCLGYEIPDIQPQLWVDETRRAAARDKLAALGVSSEEGYLVLHPFGSTKVQWWPLERVGSLAATITSRFGLKVLLIGGPETRAAADVDFGSLIDTRGLFDLGELMAVIAMSRAVVTTDSGPFHLAGALGRDIVGLFRARRPEHAGRYPAAAVILGEADGCEARCRWDRCAVLPCLQMEHISTDAAADRLAAVLKG